MLLYHKTLGSLSTKLSLCKALCLVTLVYSSFVCATSIVCPNLTLRSSHYLRQYKLATSSPLNADYLTFSMLTFSECIHPSCVSCGFHLLLHLILFFQLVDFLACDLLFHSCWTDLRP